METLPAGTRIGHYDVIGVLGAGGMGVVYRARDTRPAMAREVAIKVVGQTSTDQERLRRFEQEARVTSALNHPNILVIFDVGVAPLGDAATEASPYIVSELLDGQTLRQSLSAGRLPVRRALDYARQAALGLAAAHGKGIVHRDLKPENLFITEAGFLKILDFGLAKLRPVRQGTETGVVQAVQTQAARGDQTTTLDELAVHTGEGLVLGTVGYMAPEQVRGEPVDHRCDIFALGAVLFELLTGRRAFSGESGVETMHAILHADPPELGAESQGAPVAVDRIVRRCLEKRPEDRFQTASDLAFALEALASTSRPTTPPSASSPPDRQPARAWRSVAAAALVAAGLGAAGMWVLLPRNSAEPPTPASPVIRSQLMPPAGTVAAFQQGFAISPDGRRLALVARPPDGSFRLYVQDLELGTVAAVPGTEGAAYPFWSPDGQHIGFFTSRELKRVPAEGGAVATVCRVTVGSGGSWNADGTIVFAPGRGAGPIHRVAATGGTPEPVTRLDDESSLEQVFPSFLAEGSKFAFFERQQGVGGAIRLGDLSNGPTRVLADSGNASAAPLSVGSWLFFTRDLELRAQRLSGSTLVGQPVVLGPVRNLASWVMLSVSASGFLAYLPDQEAALRRRGLAAVAGQAPHWVNRRGQHIDRVVPELGFDIRISSRGRWLASNPANRAWLYEASTGTGQPITSQRGSLERSPVFSPDERSLVFSQSGGSRNVVVIKRLGEGTEPGELARLPGGLRPLDWSPDGEHLLVERWSGGIARTKDLWTLHLPSREVKPWLTTPDMESRARFSPNGRWVAYQSDASGQDEIYVRPFHGTGTQVRLSSAGGSDPKWRGDGRELYYVAPTGDVMAVLVNSEPGFTVEGAQVLFRDTFDVGRWSEPNPFEVTSDGQMFLLRPVLDVGPLTLLHNWPALLAR